jgi:hypothetical protein
MAEISLSIPTSTLRLLNIDVVVVGPVDIGDQILSPENTDKLLKQTLSGIFVGNLCHEFI